MIAMSMSDEISIRLNASLRRPACIYRKEVRVELKGEMWSTTATAVDPPDRLDSLHPPSLLTSERR